ncbi:MAG: helix-turn-helix domain-containing protein [bacterium]|nr:helix-turn-helix domain-containing protein [bacterium]
MFQEKTSPYLDTQEAAEYLRIRPATLDRWRSVGGGPAFIKLGGRVVYAQADLDAFAEAGRRTSTADKGAGAS